MARANTATLDGLVVGYGTRDSHNVEDSVVHTMGRIKQVEVRIDHSTHVDLATGTAPTTKSFGLPAGSMITGGRLVVLETFTDLTSIIVGTKGSDGVTEDDNGLLTTVVLADLTVGESLVLDGAQVQEEADADVVVTDEVLYVSLDVTGTAPTAGEAVLVFEYQEPVPSSTPPAVIVGEI